MATIYNELIEEVEAGKSFRVDLKRKTLKVGGKVVIDNGCYEGNLIGDLPADPWETAERLFRCYQISRPGAWSEHKRSYFKAKDASEMDEFELAAGEPRLLAQAKLEGFILCAVLSGLLRWNDRFGSWFWKSPRYPEFILLKEWFV